MLRGYFAVLHDEKCGDNVAILDNELANGLQAQKFNDGAGAESERRISTDCSRY